MPNAALIRDFKPVCDEINNLAHEGLAITALSDDPKYDFISRYFSPPQTGVPPRIPSREWRTVSSVPYWQDKTGKRSFHAYQASARGGEVWIRLTDTRAFIGGKAVTVLRVKCSNNRWWNKTQSLKTISGPKHSQTDQKRFF